MRLGGGDQHACQIHHFDVQACARDVLQEILNVTDRVQSVSSLAVAPCAQQLLTCNK